MSPPFGALLALHRGALVEIWRVERLARGAESDKSAHRDGPDQAFLLPPYTPDHGHPEISLCFTRDGARVAATAGSASVYDLTTHRRIARYAPEPVKDRSIMNWAFSPDGRSAAAATSKGVYLWSVEPGDSTRTKN